MGVPDDVYSKQKTASGTAQGSGMEKKVPIVGNSSPSKSNIGQPVTRDQMFTVKSVSWNKKSPSGY